MTENLFRDDKLSVAVKADAEREIKKAYCALGWVLDEEYGDGKYGDIIHMDFSRPHLVGGEDRLQLLQVRFEVALNFMGRAKRSIPLRATILGALLSLIGAVFVAIGLIMAFGAHGNLFLAGGVVLASAGVTFFVLAAISCAELLRTDRVRYGTIIAVLKENINSIIAEASRITGVLYED